MPSCTIHRRAAALAALVTLVATSACATRRWTEEWRALPPALRGLESAGADQQGRVVAIGNRGFRFGDRILLVVEPVHAAALGPAASGAVPVRCRSAPEECYGHLLVPSPGQDGTLVLVVRGVMIRFAAVAKLYLETEAGEAVVAAGPFAAAYQLDLGGSAAVRADAVALSCVAGEAAVLAATELARAEDDLRSERITSDESAAMSEALVRYMGVGSRLCRPGGAGAAQARGPR